MGITFNCGDTVALPSGREAVVLHVTYGHGNGNDIALICVGDPRRSVVGSLHNVKAVDVRDLRPVDA